MHRGRPVEMTNSPNRCGDLAVQDVRDVKPQQLPADNLQTDTPRLLCSPNGAAMTTSPMSSWSQTPRRLQAEDLPPNSACEVSPLCDGISTPLINCLTLQPGTWGCNTSASTGNRHNDHGLATSYSTPWQTAPHFTTSLHDTATVDPTWGPLQTGARHLQAQQLIQQLQQSEAQRLEQIQHLQAANASLQQKEQELAQLLDEQHHAHSQQEELQAATTSLCQKDQELALLIGKQHHAQSQQEELQAATASLQQKEQELAQLVATQHHAHSQQEELHQVKIVKLLASSLCCACHAASACGAKVQVMRYEPAWYLL